MNDNKLTNHPTGFSWGPMRISRLMDDRSGVWLMLSSERQQVEVRVTPAGKIKLGRVVKNDGFSVPHQD